MATLRTRHAAAEPDLDAARQSTGVKDRNEELLKEATGVAGLTGLLAQGDLERSQRADPARQLDPRSPKGARYVNERRATPEQCQQPAQDDEYHEERVQREYEVGEQSVAHARSNMAGVTLYVDGT